MTVPPRREIDLGSTTLLTDQGVRFVRRPFATDFSPCACGAPSKDDCTCNRSTKRSYIARATSGEARSSNTACAAIQATSIVSVTKTAAERKSPGIPLLIFKCLSKGFSAFTGVLSKVNVIGKSHCTEDRAPSSIEWPGGAHPAAPADGTPLRGHAVIDHTDNGTPSQQHPAGGTP